MGGLFGGLLDQPFFILFLLIGLGMALGRIKIFELSLGSSGVLFVALLFGHLGYHIPDGIGTFGLVLFVYAIGVGAGGRFFNALMNQGSNLAKVALVVVFSGSLLTWVSAKLTGIPVDLAVGLFAGALTSTPALAAGTDYLGESGDLLSIGYGIAYPFGVIGVVLFVQLLPRLLKLNLQAEGEKLDTRNQSGEQVTHFLVQVTNPELSGKLISEYDDAGNMGCHITRIYKSDRLVPLNYDDRFEVGCELMVVGKANQIDIAIRMMGKKSDRPYVLDIERERRKLLLTSKEFSGKTIRELNLLKNHGVTVSRVNRLGFTFVPHSDVALDSNDQLTVVGSPEKLDEFARVIGHRNSGFNETDLLSLGFGLALGVFVGTLTLGLPGGSSLSLGLAGGPLLVGLLLGHFGRVGGIVGHIPRETRILLQELGLVIFLAEAGVRGGSLLWVTLENYGLILFVVGLVVTLIPMAIAYLFCHWVLKLNLLETLGGICGGMTSTPALGVISAKTDSQAPVVSYATAYPVALILMTLFAKFLIQLLA